jgi:hypothetical protein
MTDKRSPQETLDVIEESADSDEAERILALSDEELDQELGAEGFDPKAVRARGAALAARLGIEASAPAPTCPRRSRNGFPGDGSRGWRRRRLPWWQSRLPG